MNMLTPANEKQMSFEPLVVLAAIALVITLALMVAAFVLAFTNVPPLPLPATCADFPVEMCSLDMVFELV